MKTTIRVLFSVVILIVIGVHFAKAEECKVADPTGTPLNVRASPNGKISQTLKNGSIVFVEKKSYQSKNGANRVWAQISQAAGNSRKILGWVFGDYISCGAEESWTEFYTNLKTAVKNRNRNFMETIFPDFIACQTWNVCKFTNGEVRANAKMVFKKWDENNYQGWSDLEKTLKSGKLTKRGHDFEESSNNEMAWKAQILETKECEGYWIDFEYSSGKWKMEHFYFGELCGH